MSSNIYPLNVTQGLSWRTRNFPEDVYDFAPSDFITELMDILVGNAGTGQLFMAQTAARLNQENMEFFDLDNIIGALLQTPRYPSEIYSTNHNPFIDQITISGWTDVLYKDSSYRERLIGVAAALTRGATPFGIQMVSDAVSGLKSRVIEVWNEQTVTVSGVTTISGTSIATRGFGQNEVVIRPRTLPDISYTTTTRNAILDSARNLKTTGSVVSVASGVVGYTQAPYVASGNTYVTNGTYSVLSGTGQFFFFDREVLGNGLNPPSYVNSNSDATIKGRYWLKNNAPTSAPQFAHLTTQESVINVTQNITTVNVTPLSTAGQPPTYSTTTMLTTPVLDITSTVYGAL
jgi:hypothetical protein